MCRFLAKHSPNLMHMSCCFAADRLYGGSLLESSLSSLAAATTHLTHLTLLNVDVTDVVLQALAKHCSQLQHIAIGRTENNAFGNFVSDEGLSALAVACHRLSSLSLFRCYSCSDAGLRELVARGRQITSLVLHSCPQVCKEDLSDLPSTTSLHSHPCHTHQPTTSALVSPLLHSRNYPLCCCNCAGDCCWSCNIP